MVSPIDADREKQSYPYHAVQHVRQRFHWDCGVSCVLMLLSPDQRHYFLEHFEQICSEEGFGQSTWTIDLCYLLKRFNVDHEMYTMMAGVNEEYRNHTFYTNIIDIDQSRVERRFATAAAAGVTVHLRAGLAPLVARLPLAPAILLVDAGLLACSYCGHNQIRIHFRGCFGGGYRGHYILVVGATKTRVLYRDPARRAPLCAASHAVLRRAAEASGTDHDAILLMTPPITR